ncbi:hypothetical protein BJ508DRAFT_338630 [Ascobolus immersus RN42]|uniref:Uncharacterized protein n=1 Tax=Ascobolus immersus RN42 TaxID=1160509 RepID=A0A3N4I147_ASCIM|nr:hypothetical protein BJ508DRAFT_338630 [Ascobolus immersus RN42]
MAIFSKLPVELRLDISKHITTWPAFTAFRQLDSTNYSLLSSPSEHVREVQFAINAKERIALENFSFFMNLNEEAGELIRRVISEAIAILNPKLTLIPQSWQTFRLDKYSNIDSITYDHWMKSQAVLAMLHHLSQRIPGTPTEVAHKYLPSSIAATANEIQYLLEDVPDFENDDFRAYESSAVAEDLCDGAYACCRSLTTLQDPRHMFYGLPFRKVLVRECYQYTKSLLGPLDSLDYDEVTPEGTEALRRASRGLEYLNLMFTLYRRVLELGYPDREDYGSLY